jgi:hypothetical protein
VSSNPEPDNQIAFAQTERALVIANLDDADAVSPFFEA